MSATAYKQACIRIDIAILHVEVERMKRQGLDRLMNKLASIVRKATAEAKNNRQAAKREKH